MYTFVPNSMLVRIICVKSTVLIFIEIEVNQPNHFFGIVKYDNQELSLHQAEEKYCYGSIKQAQQYQGNRQSIFGSAKADLELEVHAGRCNGCGSVCGGRDSPVGRSFYSEPGVDEKKRSPRPLSKTCCEL